MFQAKAEENQASGSKQKATEKPGGSYADRLDRATQRLEEVLTEFELKPGKKEKLSPVTEEEDDAEENKFDKEIWDQESPENFTSESDEDEEAPGVKSPTIL